MASDVAQSLIDSFKSSFDQLKHSSLPPEFDEVLVNIKEILNEKIIEGTWSSENISILYRLDDAMADCRLFTMEKKSLLKSLSGAVRRPDENLRSELTGIRDGIVSISKPTSLAPPNLPTSRYTTYRGDPSDAPEVVGFDGYKEEIVKLLRSGRDGFVGIGLHGMCGTGKTALVKYVLQDSEVRDKFKLQDSGDGDKSKSNVVWVCLSDITCQAELDIKIVKHILEELGHDTDEWTVENPSITDVGLVKKLRDVLQNLGNYIIVLDDLWYCNDWFGNLLVQADGNQDYKRFSHILPKFKDGSECGAVIVTTRIKEVAANMVGSKNLIHLQPLKEEFMKKLVSRTMKQHMEDDKRVDEVAYHCHGLPFVAKMSNFVYEQIAWEQQPPNDDLPTSKASLKLSLEAQAAPPDEGEAEKEVED